MLPAVWFTVGVAGVIQGVAA
jgi:hypothetical protein